MIFCNQENRRAPELKLSVGFVPRRPGRHFAMTIFGDGFPKENETYNINKGLNKVNEENKPK